MIRPPHDLAPREQEAIRASHARGVSIRFLAREYRVDRRVVQSIVREDADAAQPRGDRPASPR